VLVSCGGNGDCTVWDTRTWGIRATLQGRWVGGCVSKQGEEKGSSSKKKDG